MFFLSDLLKYLAMLCVIGACASLGAWAFALQFEQLLQMLARG